MKKPEKMDVPRNMKTDEIVVCIDYRKYGPVIYRGRDIEPMMRIYETEWKDGIGQQPSFGGVRVYIPARNGETIMAWRRRTRRKHLLKQGTHVFRRDEIDYVEGGP